MISVHAFLMRENRQTIIPYWKFYNIANVEANQILFGTETYVNTLNKCVKFNVKIPAHFWEIGTKL